jgi:hypothetical protein
MIDTKSGNVVLDGRHTIAPSLSLAAFLASPLAAEAQSVGVAEDWPRFFLGVHEIFGDPCTVSVGFHGQRLLGVSLNPVDPDATEPSDDYDVQAALAAKARHDAWLAAKLGPPPYVNRWGTIESVYDPRSVSSSIFVTYSSP